MSLHSYLRAIELMKEDEPFYALIMAAMLKADSTNLPKLERMWPATAQELKMRYNAPGGRLEGEA